jgi:tetratricopeptide (TPR) repeat protein
VLAAHAWCDRAPDGAAAGLRLASAMRRYWIIRGLLGLGLRVTVEALARPGAERRDAARCRGLFDAGQIASWMGRYADAQGHLQESIAIARELGDKQSIAAALQPLGLASLGLGDYAAARAQAEEGVALAREIGTKRDLAAALNALAQTARAGGDPEAAEPLYEQVLAIARELDDPEVVGIALLNLAMVAMSRGNIGRVPAMLQETLALAEQMGSKPMGQSVLEVSAGLAAVRREWERAARLFGAVEAQMAQTGLHRDPADEAFLAPLIAATREGLGRDAYAAAEAGGRALAYDEAMTEARGWLATCI